MINDNETPERRAQREQLQRITVGFAAMLKQRLDGAGVGFAIVLYDFGDAGSIAYAADGVRDDLVKAFRELADKLEIDQAAKVIARKDS